MRTVEYPEIAKVLVVPRLEALPLDALLGAVLQGKYIIMPQFLHTDGRKGSALKMKGQLEVRRRIWISPHFASEAPELAAELLRGCSVGQHWMHVQEPLHKTRSHLETLPSKANSPFL